MALLRAGLAGPDVLILDEATSSVDALTEVRVARALERLAASRTTIAIAHRLSTAARADRILVLDHGRLVEDGHHDDLVARERPVSPALRRLGLLDLGVAVGRRSRSGSGLDVEAERSGPVTSVTMQSTSSRPTWRVSSNTADSPGATSSTNARAERCGLFVPGLVNAICTVKSASKSSRFSISPTT